MSSSSSSSSSSSPAAAATASSVSFSPLGPGRHYLVQSILGSQKTWQNFRWHELRAVCQQHGCPNLLDWAAAPRASPYAFPARLDDEALAARVVARCVMTRGIYEVWGHGRTLAECQDAVRGFPAALRAPFVRADQTWAMSTVCIGASLKAERRRAYIDAFNFVEHGGGVSLKAPDVRFALVIVMPFDDSNVQVTVADQTPVHFYFCREVAVNETKPWISGYSLKSRAYIGPTSCSADLAFIMANLALVGGCSTVLDPFVGTGSILIACTAVGARCFGADLDWKMIRGRTRVEGHIRDNFRQYKLPMPELLCADLSLPLWRASVFDAIVCDPPYGVRAGARKSGLPDKKELKEVIDTEDNRHIPATKPYPVDEMMCDLLDRTAELLRVGGRFVYLLPVPTLRVDAAGATVAIDAAELALPEHPALRLVCVCEQVLRLGFSRLCVVMEKHRETRDDRCTRPEPGVTPAYALMQDKDFQQALTADVPFDSLQRRRKKRLRRQEKLINDASAERNAYEVFLAEENEKLPLDTLSKKEKIRVRAERREKWAALLVQQQQQQQVPGNDGAALTITDDNNK